MRLPLLAAGLLASAAAHAAPLTYVAPLAPARDLAPVGEVRAVFDAEANQLRITIETAAGALAAGDHQIHLHANYAGNRLIGDPPTAQIEALPPATTDDIDGDGAIEVFEAVPLIGESWWTLATVAVGDDGRLVWDSGLLDVSAAQLFAADPITLGSPGVSGPEDIDYPFDIDNIGFFRSALDNFGLLAFDIHGAPDAGGIDFGEIDGIGGYEPLKPALGGAFGAAVPEPASWALMIAGFGLVGAAARRRGQIALTAA